MTSCLRENDFIIERFEYLLRRIDVSIFSNCARELSTVFPRTTVIKYRYIWQHEKVRATGRDLFGTFTGRQYQNFALHAHLPVTEKPFSLELQTSGERET